MNRSIFVVFFISIIASYYALTKTKENLTSENLHEQIEAKLQILKKKAEQSWAELAKTFLWA